MTDDFKHTDRSTTAANRQSLYRRASLLAMMAALGLASTGPWNDAAAQTAQANTAAAAASKAAADAAAKAAANAAQRAAADAAAKASAKAAADAAAKASAKAAADAAAKAA